MAFRLQGDNDRAVPDLDRAIKINTGSRVGLPRPPGCAYYDRGDYDRAIADLSQAIKLDATDVAAFNDRGIAYGAKGDP